MLQLVPSVPDTFQEACSERPVHVPHTYVHRSTQCKARLGATFSSGTNCSDTILLVRCNCMSSSKHRKLLTKFIFWYVTEQNLRTPKHTCTLLRSSKRPHGR